MVVEHRQPLYADYTGPGPLGYNLKTTVGHSDVCTTKTRAPAYSLGLKLRGEKYDSPGPIYGVDGNLTSRGRQCPPCYSLQSRQPIKGLEVLPGPGTYDSSSVKQGTLSRERKPPAISMGQHTKNVFKNEAPAPNLYNPQVVSIGDRYSTAKGAPSWGLKGRFPHGSPYYMTMKAEIPGPATYGAWDPRKTKRASGQFSMQGRTRFKDYNSAKDNPGPGAYNPDKPRKGGKGPTMGIRHSLYTLPLISSADIC